MDVELILAIVLAVCTVAYTLINFYILKESQLTRKQKITPHIIAYVSTTEDHSVLSLKFKNIGEGLAKNIKVKVNNDYRQFGQEGLLLSEFSIVKNGLNFFPPQHEIQYYLDDPVSVNKNNPDGIISLEISYENIYNKKIKDQFQLPFNQILGQNYSNPPESYIGKIPYYLNLINQTLTQKNITNHNT